MQYSVGVYASYNALLRNLHSKWHQTASDKNKTLKLNSSTTS